MTKRFSDINLDLGQAGPPLYMWPSVSTTEYDGPSRMSNLESRWFLVSGLCHCPDLGQHCVQAACFLLTLLYIIPSTPLGKDLFSHSPFHSSCPYRSAPPSRPSLPHPLFPPSGACLGDLCAMLYAQLTTDNYFNPPKSSRASTLESCLQLAQAERTDSSPTQTSSPLVLFPKPLSDAH